MQTGPGGKNLPSGDGVSRRSAAGGSEERLSDQCRRGDPEGFLGAVGRKRGPGGPGRRLEIWRRPCPLLPNHTCRWQTRACPGGPRPDGGQDSSLRPLGPFPEWLPAPLSRQGGLSGLSLLPSPIPTPTSSRLLLVAGSPSPGSAAGPLTAERPARGAPVGWGQLRAPPAILPQMSGRSGSLGPAPAAGAGPLSSPLPALLTGRGQAGQSVDSNWSNTAFTACWEPAVSSRLALSPLQMAEPRRHGFRGG